MSKESQENLRSNSGFKPVHISFDEGIERIKKALAETNIELGSRILTSRDADVVKACNLLAVDQAPKGFIKWQLPFFLEGGQFFITSANPGANIGEHTHPDEGVRFIISGSIEYDGIELNAGDWMFIPKDKSYSFKVGPHGASMFYCYPCCCASFDLSRQEVINPATYTRNRHSI